MFALSASLHAQHSLFSVFLVRIYSALPRVCLKSSIGMQFCPPDGGKSLRMTGSILDLLQLHRAILCSKHLCNSSCVLRFLCCILGCLTPESPSIHRVLQAQALPASCASGSLDLQAPVACSTSEELCDLLHEPLNAQGSWQTGHPTATSQFFRSDPALSLFSAEP